MVVRQLYLATLLGTDGYGQLSYILAFAGTAIVISNLGTHITITVNTSKTKIIEPSLYILPIIISITSSVILFLINQSPYLIIYVVGSVVTTLYLYTLLGLKYYKKYARVIIFEEILVELLNSFKIFSLKLFESVLFLILIVFNICC